MRDAALVLKEHFAGRGYKVNTMEFPNWAVYLAALFNAEARSTLDALGKEAEINTSHIREILKLEFRDMKEMVVSMGESMIELGML